MLKRCLVSGFMRGCSQLGGGLAHCGRMFGNAPHDLFDAADEDIEPDGDFVNFVTPVHFDAVGQVALAFSDVLNAKSQRAERQNHLELNDPPGSRADECRKNEHEQSSKPATLRPQIDRVQLCLEAGSDRFV